MMMMMMMTKMMMMMTMSTPYKSLPLPSLSPFARHFPQLPVYLCMIIMFIGILQDLRDHVDRVHHDQHVSSWSSRSPSTTYYDYHDTHDQDNLVIMAMNHDSWLTFSITGQITVIKTDHDRDNDELWILIGFFKLQVSNKHMESWNSGKEQIYLAMDQKYDLSRFYILFGIKG